MKLIEGLPNDDCLKRLKDEIREFDDNELVDKVFPFLDRVEGRPRIGLVKVLSSQIKSKSNNVALLKIGCDKRIASEIGDWIKVIYPRIGIRSFVGVAKGYKVNQPDIFDMVYYKASFILGDAEMELLNSSLQET